MLGDSGTLSQPHSRYGLGLQAESQERCGASVFPVAGQNVRGAWVERAGGPLGGSFRSARRPQMQCEHLTWKTNMVTTRGSTPCSSRLSPPTWPTHFSSREAKYSLSMPTRKAVRGTGAKQVRAAFAQSWVSTGRHSPAIFRPFLRTMIRL